MVEDYFINITQYKYMNMPQNDDKDLMKVYALTHYNHLQRDLALFLVKQGTMKLSNCKMCDVK